LEEAEVSNDHGNRRIDRDSGLAVADLHKRFGKKHVVKDVSFSMQEGEVVGFLGPNGAGKTTVFYIIVGFIHPNAGKVLLDGRNLTGEPMYRRARRGIAYLPQEASVFRKLTVEQNLWAILQTRKDLTRHQKHARLEELLYELGIEENRRQKAFTLSGGERRRTEIARSLAIAPKFLLLDEPFAGIDPIAVYEIKSIIADLSQKGIGILITDHNVRDTLEITNRSYIIKDGEIVVSGSREEVMQNDLARKVYLGEQFQM
jgi:lipopolysaccharide export system ATP-binding protein